MASNVKFIKSDSVDYMIRCKQKFDLIFLDGSHQADVVYNEMPCAINLLNPNGIILLHDFYPNNKPLWDNNVILPGPYLAINRFHQFNTVINRNYPSFLISTILNNKFYIQ